MRRNSKASTLGTILTISAATILLEAGRRAFRRSQVFNPTRAPIRSWHPADYDIDDATEVEFETADGQLLFGWYCRAGSPIASAVYCHGNSGNITDTAPAIPHLLRAGISVFLFDYRGFGRSTGIPTPKGLILDALAAAREHEALRPQNLPSLAYGYSLGGPVAAELARRLPFDGLILQSTFTSLREVARVAFPRLPMHFFAGNVFDTIEALVEARLPLLVIHGREDEVCPAWMADALFSRSEGAREIFYVDGARHKDIWEIDPHNVIDAIRRFAALLAPEPERSLVFPEPSLTQRWLRLMRKQFRQFRPAA